MFSSFLLELFDSKKENNQLSWGKWNGGSEYSLEKVKT